eukprot:747566-Pleurochrysis_carterae.AAC.1
MFAVLSPLSVLYGIVLYSFSTTNLHVRIRTVYPRETEPPSARKSACYGLDFTLQIATGSDAHFHQFARAASALASASMPSTSVPVQTVAASSNPPPTSDANGTAALPAQGTQPTHLRLSAPAWRIPGELVFVPRRLSPAYACHEHGGRGWTGRDLSLTKRSVLVALPFDADEHGRRYAPVRLPHAH